VGVHCDIYKGSYNVSNTSYLNSPPSLFSFIPSFPNSRNSFNRNGFIFTPFYPLSLSSVPPHWCQSPLLPTPTNRTHTPPSLTHIESHKHTHTQSHLCEHTFTHTLASPHIHTLTHTHITHTQLHSNTNSHIDSHTHLHTPSHIHRHGLIHPYTRANTHSLTYIHRHMHTLTYTERHTHKIRIYKHKHIPWLTHTHTDPFIHSQSQTVFCPPVL
jgi:hypothetical protein